MNYIDSANNILKNFLYNENKSPEAIRIFRKLLESNESSKA